MNKATALSVVLALLIASPALARTHHHRQPDPTSYGNTERNYVPPPYSNEVPFAPFGS
jgi:hypothetical protein